jgi:hypothetical protein
MEQDGMAQTRLHGAEQNVFIPLIILTLAAVSWAAFQMTQLLRERDALAAARVAQEQPLENAKKLRDGLDTLAKQTQLLATKGNPSAKLIVDELKKRGITINPDAPPANQASPEPKK